MADARTFNRNLGFVFGRSDAGVASAADRALKNNEASKHNSGNRETGYDVNNAVHAQLFRV